MKENALQIMLAILLGLAVPGIIVRLTTDTSQVVPYHTTAPQQTETGQQSDGIWVLTAEQKLQWMHPQDYLTGVLLAEMPTSFEPDALCAQAVAARTYAMKRSIDNRHPYGAVCTDAACCQAYVDIPTYLDGLGFSEDVDIARDAVRRTDGLVLTYGGELIEATYFHSSGGSTEAAVAVWGVDYPYLQAVESPEEETASSRTFYSREELEQLLVRQLPGSPSGWVGWMTYTVGGGVENILLAGIEYTGLQLRSLLKLNSTAFTVTAEGDGLCFTTRGKGHRVGLSQLGAQAMAQQGYSWQQILAHYYPGAGIDKMENVG